MDPGTIINIVALVVKLLEVVRGACNDGSKRRKRYRDELHRFGKEIDENLQFANNIKEQAVGLGFKSKSLDTLHDVLQNFVSSAKDLLSSNNCKKEDIERLREQYMDTFQKQMERIPMEMWLQSCKDMKAVKEMLAKKQEMVSKNGVHISIFPGQACGNPMLMGLVPDVPESLWECIFRVIADEHFNPEVPTEEVGPYVHRCRVADVGMIKGVEDSGRIKEDAAKYVPEEEKKDKKKKDGAGMDELEKEKMKEAPSTERVPGQWSIGIEKQDTEGQDSMELIKKGGKGELLMSKLEGRHIEMTYTWHEESMGIVIANSPMEVSQKLGYAYFEVKLEEMAELVEGIETGLAGVGVGLARNDKFRTSKMAGKYSKSCGYDSRVGEVYYENRVQERPSRMGSLAMGDTLGIGLLQHHGQPLIFFAKNRELQVCFQVGSLFASSSHGGVYPVISLASAHVRLHVNFQGPFELSELLAKVKAHK